MATKLECRLRPAVTCTSQGIYIVHIVLYMVRERNFSNSYVFCENLPRTNNIAHAEFQGFIVIVSVFTVFRALSTIGKRTSYHRFVYGGL